MARGVDYLNGALAVAYIELENYIACDSDDIDSDYFFRESLDCTKEELQQEWPSFYEVDEWQGETHIIARNGHALVGVAEYCGLVSISIAPDRNCEHAELAEAWVLKVADKFVNKFGTLRKLGTFSNGESVFERIA